MERKSETRLRYQSELSKCGGGSFRLQSLIGLVINGTKNQISDRKILIWIGQKECSLSEIFVLKSLIFFKVRLSYKSIRI